MQTIIIDNQEYRVIETLPFYQTGKFAKRVETDFGDRIVVKDCGKWRFRTKGDQIGDYGWLT